MKPTIFIVDDDKNIQKMLEMFIQREDLGTIVGIQDSGAEAPEDILFLQPDIVLLDLLLPGKDGIHVLEDIMREGYQGKVIMISQVDDPSMMEKAYERGIMFYINKPLNAIEVVSVISNVSKLVSLQKSMETIQGALLGVEASVSPVPGTNILNERFKKTCTDIGILGTKGIDDLKKVVFLVIDYQKSEQTYQMKDIYEKAASSIYGPAYQSQDKKALEQRIRRIMLKALDNITQLGMEDYYNPVFADYANLLFDFGQVRIRMQQFKDNSSNSGHVSVKKFIEGLSHSIYY